MTAILGTSIIRDVTLNYVKVDPENPTDPFGTLQWECQIVAPAERASELEGYGSVKPVKDDPSRVAVNLKRKALRKDGTENDPVVLSMVRNNQLILRSRLVTVLKVTSKYIVENTMWLVVKVSQLL